MDSLQKTEKLNSTYITVVQRSCEAIKMGEAGTFQSCLRCRDVAGPLLHYISITYCIFI